MAVPVIVAVLARVIFDATGIAVVTRYTAVLDPAPPETSAKVPVPATPPTASVRSPEAIAAHVPELRVNVTESSTLSPSPAPRKTVVAAGVMTVRVDSFMIVCAAGAGAVAVLGVEIVAA
jgi:hypothetical protein